MRIVTFHSLTEARAYSAAGILVIPQRPFDKRPLVQWGEFSRDVNKWDVSLVEKWWRHDFAGAGVMAVLGRVSQLCAVDIDGKNAYQAFIGEMGHLPRTATVKSGNPDPYRLHQLFRMPPGLETAAKITPWDTGLEFRGQGGLTILPPSIHPSGRPYQWFRGLSLWEVGLAELPERIANEFANHNNLRRISNQSKNPGRTDPIGISFSSIITPLERLCIHQMRGIRRATRRFLLGDYWSGPRWNDRMFAAACDLNACGWSESDATPLLLKGAQPWDQDEVQRALATIQSAYSTQRTRYR